jgi:hypothetical protein
MQYRHRRVTEAAANEMAEAIQRNYGSRMSKQAKVRDHLD